MYNYEVLKVTNIHQVKVNDHDEVNGTHVHTVFQVCCIGSILLLLISISYIIHLINFLKYKIFLIYAV